MEERGFINPVIKPSEEITTDKRFFELRKGIVNFAKDLAQEMHKYCDPITLASHEGPDRGALYGDYSGHYGTTENWNLMMSLGTQASYIAAYLIDSERFQSAVPEEWNKIRGKVPEKYSTCWAMLDEMDACKNALEYVGLCYSILFEGLDDDDKNPLRKGDTARRNKFKDWSTNTLANLISLVKSANKAIEDRLQSPACPADDLSVLANQSLDYEKLLFEKLKPGIASEIKEKVAAKEHTMESKVDPGITIKKK